MKRNPCSLLECFNRVIRLCTLLALCFLVVIYFGNKYVSLTLPLPPCPSSSCGSYGLLEAKDVSYKKTTISFETSIFHCLILTIWLILLLYHAWLLICRDTNYVLFNTNLSLFRKNKNLSIVPYFTCLWYFSASFLALVLLLSEYDANGMYLLLTIMAPNFQFLLFSKLVIYVFSKFKKTILLTFFVASVILIFSISTTPKTQYVCIYVLQISCLNFAKNSPS